MAYTEDPGGILAFYVTDSETERAFQVATGFIAFRMRSEREVERRLKRADVGPATIETTLRRLKDVGLVDDRAFAGAYCRDQIVGRGRGPIRVRRGLASLGVGADLAEEAIQSVLEEHSPLEKAVSLAEKRWMILARISDERQRRKRVFDYLIRRGYQHADARTAVDRLEV